MKNIILIKSELTSGSILDIVYYNYSKDEIINSKMKLTPIQIEDIKSGEVSEDEVISKMTKLKNKVILDYDEICDIYRGFFNQSFGGRYKVARVIPDEIKTLLKNIIRNKKLDSIGI